VAAILSVRCVPSWHILFWHSWRMVNMFFSAAVDDARSLCSLSLSCCLSSALHSKETLGDRRPVVSFFALHTLLRLSTIAKWSEEEIRRLDYLQVYVRNPLREVRFCLFLFFFLFLFF
jgi:hypothetical protein